MTINEMKIAERIGRIPSSATIRIADHTAELIRQGKDVLDFSAGRAAEHSPDYINRAAAQALIDGDTHQTMAQGTPKFREMVARKLERDNGIKADPDKNIIATLGCKNGLTLGIFSTIDPGDEVIIEDPCFVSYNATIGLCGGVPVPVPLREENNFRWDLKELEAALTDRTKAILMCSPHNPCGTVHTEDDLDMIAEVAQKHNLWVITDEIYERLTLGGRKHTCIASRPGMMERTITLMGFTKTFSMGGWRIGFACVPETVIGPMVILQQHMMTCAGSFTQAGAAAAFEEDYHTDVKEMWLDWEKRVDYVTKEINKIPKLSCHQPEGSFYAWINAEKTGELSVELAERLLNEHYIALVPGSAFGATGEGYLRMTCVKSWEDITEGVRRLGNGVK
ncbi:MAG: pyridoxal phosphate-dependent aminotransferase [bacterium]|nr:pyridoxal phosphate-dependent aminotransferase [bacterium]